MAGSAKVCSRESSARSIPGRRRSGRLASMRRPAAIRTSSPWSIPEEPAARSRDPRTTHRRILDRRGSGARAPIGCRVRLRAQGWRPFHRLVGCRRSVSRGDEVAAGRPESARVRTRQLHGGAALSADESSRVLADVQRTGHGHRETPVQRVAGVRLLYMVEGLWVADVERRDRLGFPGQYDCRHAVPHLRTGSEQPDQYSGPPAKRSPSHAADHGSVDVPRTGFVVAANTQHFSGKPWAATSQVLLPQGDQRILLEPPGSRRLSSQTIVDVRVSRTISFGGGARVELLVDVLNALNDAAGESLATDNLFSPNFGQPSVFMDPRRAMVGVRLSLGR